MSFGSLTDEVALPAYAEGRPAHGDTEYAIEAVDEVEEFSARRMDWRLFVAFFTPVIAAYAAIGYGLYVLANALF